MRAKGIRCARPAARAPARSCSRPDGEAGQYYRRVRGDRSCGAPAARHLNDRRSGGSPRPRLRERSVKGPGHRSRERGQNRLASVQPRRVGWRVANSAPSLPAAPLPSIGPIFFGCSKGSLSAAGRCRGCSAFIAGLAARPAGGRGPSLLAQLGEARFDSLDHAHRNAVVWVYLAVDLSHLRHGGDAELAGQ